MCDAIEQTAPVASAEARPAAAQSAAGLAPPPEAGASSAPADYFVHLDNFEGPLDLLLHLIKQDEVEIWEISIARITRQYVDYLERMEALNVEIAGEFLVMAASLMRLKSKRLVPRPVPVDEASDEPQTAEELIARLLAYKMFKEAAAHLRQRTEEAGPRFPRSWRQGLPADYEYPLQDIDLYALSEAWFQAQRRRLVAETSVHAVQLEDVRLEDQIAHVLDQLEAGGGRLRFDDLFGVDAGRMEVAVTLLATLELARQQVLTLLQDEPCSDLWILARALAEASSPERRHALDEAFVTTARR